MACGLERLFAKSFPIGHVLECSGVSFRRKPECMEKGCTLRSFLDVTLGDIPSGHLDKKVRDFKTPEV